MYSQYKTYIYPEKQKKKGTNLVPPTQPIIQDRVLSLKNYHAIKPTLGKEVTTVMIHNVSALFHHVFKLIAHLQNPYTTSIFLRKAMSNHERKNHTYHCSDRRTHKTCYGIYQLTRKIDRQHQAQINVRRHKIIPEGSG